MAVAKQKPRQGGAPRRAPSPSARGRIRGDTGNAKKAEKAKAAAQQADSKDRSWRNEALSLVLFVFGSFLFLALMSHWRSLSLGLSMTELDAYQRANLMGVSGHVAATLLFGLFGFCAFAPVCTAFLLGYSLYHTDERDVFWQGKQPVVFGFLGLLFSSCVLAALWFGRIGGGSVGDFLAGLLEAGIGLGGGLLVGFAFLILSSGLLLQRSLLRLLRDGSVWVWKSAVFLCWSLPVFLCTLAWKACVWVSEAVFGREYSRFPWRRQVAEDEAEGEEHLEQALEAYRAKKLKKKKLKKRKIRGMPQDAVSDEEAELAEQAHEVVVERQVSAQRMSKEQLRAMRKRIEEAREAKRLLDDVYHASYQVPSLDLLTQATPCPTEENDQILRALSAKIEAKLKDFHIEGQVTHVHPGPVVTLFEFKPAAGVKVGKIASLQDDLAMSLRATSIRVIAPIPKRGTVGIEVPNKTREVVRLRELLESEAFLADESILSIPIGKDVYGHPVVADIANMPHLLMAGATGTGKSVSINAILLSLLYRANPAELGLILIDPKILELSVYDNIPHLRVPVVTEPKKAKGVLLWAVHEMERRYRAMQKYGVRNIDGFNALAKGEVDPDMEGASQQPSRAQNPITSSEVILGQDGEPNIEREDTDFFDEQAGEKVSRSGGGEKLRPLPKIVIVIDELADLMLTVGREIEELITRLAQKARAAGIHLILATQRPSVDVITGLIKANFPARLSFRVTSRIDSRTILDAMGAEKLLGRGDMLFMRPGEMQPQRVHGAFVTDTEVLRVVSEIKKHSKPHYSQEILDMCEKAAQDEGNALGGGTGEFGEGEYDEFYDKAVELVLEKGQASTSMIQRAFRIGYNRAARIIEMMEREGLVGPVDGARPRQVIVPET